MVVDIILSLSFFLLLGLTILNVNKIINTDREFRALMYNSDVIQFLLSSSMLVLVALSIFIFFFYSWKLFLILLLGGYVIETRMVVPFVEKVLCLIVEKIEKTISKNKKR